MPYVTPTREEILTRIKASMRLELGNDPLRRSVEYALARALMDQSKGQYQFLAYIFRQAFADTADAFYFWRWAGIFGIDQKAATPWQGTMLATGVDGFDIEADTVWTRTDGKAYRVVSTVTIGDDVSGQAVVSLVCTTAGADGNNDDDQQLASPGILGVASTGTVTDTTHTGTDLETQSEALIRLLQRLRTPPSGGGPGDYIRWALEVPGVTRAWEFANLEAENSVSVAFVRDGDGSGSAIIPDSDERAEVLAYIQSKAPITVDVRVITLVALPVDVQVSSLDPSTPEVEAAIEAALVDFLFREGEPDGEIVLSRLDAAISEADGEISHVLDSPVANITSTSVQMPVFGTLTVV